MNSTPGFLVNFWPFWHFLAVDFWFFLSRYFPLICISCQITLGGIYEGRDSILKRTAWSTGNWKSSIVLLLFDMFRDVYFHMGGILRATKVKALKCTNISMDWLQINVFQFLKQKHLLLHLFWAANWKCLWKILLPARKRLVRFTNPLATWQLGNLTTRKKAHNHMSLRKIYPLAIIVPLTLADMVQRLPALKAHF